MRRRDRVFGAFGRWVPACMVVVCLTTTAYAQPAGTPPAADEKVPYLHVFVVNSGPITWFILIPLSIAVLALIIRYAIVIRRKNLLPSEIHEQIDQMFQARQFREAMELAGNDPSLLGQVVHSGLHEAPNGYAAMQRAVNESAEEHSLRILRRVEILNIIGNISPMIGLFGTVTGMILAFWALVTIVQKGGVTDAAQLASGIMYALGTTFWGLLVAIPALAAFSWFRGRVEALTDETVQVASELMQVFKPSSKKQQ